MRISAPVNCMMSTPRADECARCARGRANVANLGQLPVALAWSARPPRLDRVESRDWGSQADSRETRWRLWRRGGSYQRPLLQYSNRASRPGNRDITGETRRRSSRRLLRCNIGARRCAATGGDPLPPIIAAPTADRQTGFASGNLGLARGRRAPRLQAGDVRRARRGRRAGHRPGRDAEADREILGQAGRASCRCCFSASCRTRSTTISAGRRCARRGRRCCRRSGHKDDKDDDYDPLETLQSRTDTNIAADPARQAEQARRSG